MTVQLPAPVSVTRAPFTVQLPLAANDTGRPELAVADTVKGASPKVLFANSAKLIVWVGVSMMVMVAVPFAPTS